MGPHDAPTLVLSILLTIAAVVGCLLLWSRMPGPTPVKVCGRIGLILVCQITALAMAGLAINISRDFYTTWSDVAYDFGFGGDVNNGPGQIAGDTPDGGNPGKAGTGSQIAWRPKFKSDTKVYQGDIVGPSSHIKGQVDVWLPPGYDPNTKYPVLEIFPGQPGVPTAWFGAASRIQIGKQLSTLISQGRVKPFIVVGVAINVVNDHPQDCADVPGQAKVATWLTKDIHQFMIEHYKVKEDAASWGIMGYSEGAFCAVKLATQFPHLYHTAVGIAGSYHPSLPAITGNPQLMRENDPFELVQSNPPVSLLFATSAADPETPPSEFEALEKSVHSPMPKAKHIIQPNGGHLTAVWGSMMPTILPWISDKLTADGLA